MGKTNRDGETTASGTVLVFSLAGRGAVHAAGCRAVAAALRRRSGQVVSPAAGTDLDAEVADLRQRGYAVKTCGCVRRPTR